MSSRTACSRSARRKFGIQAVPRRRRRAYRPRQHQSLSPCQEANPPIEQDQRQRGKSPSVRGRARHIESQVDGARNPGFRPGETRKQRRKNQWKGGQKDRPELKSAQHSGFETSPAENQCRKGGRAEGERRSAGVKYGFRHRSLGHALHRPKLRARKGAGDFAF